jgi:hypothetical protein
MRVPDVEGLAAKLYNTCLEPERLTLPWRKISASQQSIWIAKAQAAIDYLLGCGERVETTPVREQQPVNGILWKMVTTGYAVRLAVPTPGSYTVIPAEGKL